MEIKRISNIHVGLIECDSETGHQQTCHLYRSTSSALTHMTDSKGVSCKVVEAIFGHQKMRSNH